MGLHKFWEESNSIKTLNETSQHKLQITITIFTLPFQFFSKFIYLAVDSSLELMCSLKHPVL